MAEGDGWWVVVAQVVDGRYPGEERRVCADGEAVIASEALSLADARARRDAFVHGRYLNTAVPTVRRLRYAVHAIGRQESAVEAVGCARCKRLPANP